MGYVCPTNDVEQQLREAGLQLSTPPSSIDVLDLLDKIEQLLTGVAQVPSLSMQGALVPSMGALIADELLRHPDLDVKISVASCLCEIVRITAPEPPYKDEIMKEIFQLNVMAFGKLSDMNGRKYHKAVHILESIAKVKSCLLMLDLECDALIVEMFEHFLSTISTNHAHAIFSDMEAIMTLVILESDEIATELLSLLLSHVRRENQNVSPMSWKLAEKVLTNCNDTLKPYSQTVKKLISSNADNYAEVVASLCQKANENELVVTNSAVADITKELTVTDSAVVDTVMNKDDNTLGNGGSTNALVHSQPNKQKDNDTQRVAAALKIRVKPNTVSSKLDDGSHISRLKGKELDASQNHSQPNKQKDNDTQRATAALKIRDVKPGTVSSKPDDGSQISRLQGKELEASQNLSPPNESHSLKGLPRNKKNNINQDTRPDIIQHSKEDSPLKEKSEGVKGSKGKPEKGSTKTKGSAKTGSKTSKAVDSVVLKQEDEPLSDSRKAESSSRKMNIRDRSRRKPSSKKHFPTASGKKDSKDARQLKEYGEELVGQRVKVWWPLDKMFYEGYVHSYDAVKKKHQILYIDGDEEILYLPEEKWEIVDDKSSDRQPEQVADVPSPTTATTSAKHQKQKEKEKTKSSLKRKDSSSLLESQTPYSSIEPTKEHSIRDKNGSATNTVGNLDSQKDDIVQMLDIRCGGKSTGTVDREGPGTDMEQEAKLESKPCTESEILKRSESMEAEESGTGTGKKRRRLVQSEKSVSQT